jgi:hypothetical protein
MEPETASPGAPAPVAHRLNHFQVTAELCPQVLLRILGLVSQHALIPRNVVCERREDGLHVEIEVDGLPDERAEILLAKMAAIVMVREAVLTRC